MSPTVESKKSKYILKPASTDQRDLESHHEEAMEFFNEFSDNSTPLAKRTQMKAAFDQLISWLFERGWEILQRWAPNGVKMLTQGENVNTQKDCDVIVFEEDEESQPQGD